MIMNVLLIFVLEINVFLQICFRDSWAGSGEIFRRIRTFFKYSSILFLMEKRGINFFKKKKGIASEALPWILIAIAILAILLITIFVLKDKGFVLIDRIKEMFRI